MRSFISKRRKLLIIPKPSCKLQTSCQMSVCSGPSIPRLEEIGFKMYIFDRLSFGNIQKLMFLC